MASERPIPFSGPMVRALLAGAKTQTRRIVKWPKWCNPEEAELMFRGNPEVAWFQDGVPRKRFSCPYGKPGDALWVREAWRVAECYDDKSGSELSGIVSVRNVQYAEQADQFLGKVQGRYRHARFMPRWASRITLEITGVRVERLQEISEADARAEGYSTMEGPRRWYSRIWDEINCPDENDESSAGNSWVTNPWVWVVEFKLAKPTNELAAQGAAP